MDGMKRLKGDRQVAMQFYGVKSLIEQAQAELRDGNPVAAMGTVTRAEMVFNRALCDLEAVTDVPWTALGDGSIGWNAED